MGEATHNRELEPDIGSLVIATKTASDDGWPDTLGVVIRLDPIDCLVLFSGWGLSWIFIDYLRVINEGG